MLGNREKIGDPVKVGFLTLYLVGFFRGGRVVRDAAGTKFYVAPYYYGLYEIDPNSPLTGQPERAVIENAAKHDAVVKSALVNIFREKA